MIVRIGRMIAYQEYNTRSPLNGLAAKWAAEHQNILPIDDRIVAPATEPTGTAPATAQSQGADGSSHSSGHGSSQESPQPDGNGWPERIVVR